LASMPSAAAAASGNRKMLNSNDFNGGGQHSAGPIQHSNYASHALVCACSSVLLLGPLSGILQLQLTWHPIILQQLPGSCQSSCQSLICAVQHSMRSRHQNPQAAMQCRCMEKTAYHQHISIRK
jgi:hypothetical protein